jgi:hypothetical protein
MYRTQGGGLTNFICVRAKKRTEEKEEKIIAEMSTETIGSTSMGNDIFKVLKKAPTNSVPHTLQNFLSNTSMN